MLDEWVEPSDVFNVNTRQEDDNSRDFELLAAAANENQRRREETLRRQAETDFLVGALRESERLRSLAASPSAPKHQQQLLNGHDNLAFAADCGPEFETPSEQLFPDNYYDELADDDVGDIGDFLRQLRGEDPDDILMETEKTEKLDDKSTDEQRLVPNWLAQFLTSVKFSAVYGLTRRVTDAVEVAMFGDQDSFRGAEAQFSSEAVSSAIGNAGGSNGATAELIRLLKEPHMVALMRAHDEAAISLVPPPPELPQPCLTVEDMAIVATADSVASTPTESLPSPTAPEAVPCSRLAAPMPLLAAANIRVLVTAPTPSPSASPSAHSAASAGSSTIDEAGDDHGRQQGGEAARECRAEDVVQDGVRFRRVVLMKRNGSLGATVKNVGDSVIIGRIVCGGLLEQVGDLISEGDELISVNGIGLTGKHVNEVYDLLQGLTGRLVFLTSPCTEYRPIERNNNNSSSSNNNTDNSLGGPSVLKALFTYEPAEDLYNPCREAGLAFQVGDLIRVLSTRDPNWWQGCKLAETSGAEVRGAPTGSLAGIFPSPDFQRRRQLMLSMATGGELAGRREGGRQSGSSTKSWRCLCPAACSRCFSPLISRFQRSRSSRYAPEDLSASSASSNCDSENDSTVDTIGARKGLRRRGRRFFEPQALLQPQPHRRRPLVLVGPPGVGRHELRVRLIESDPARFAPAVLHTTRQARPDETNGLDFQFTTRQEFMRRKRHGEGFFLETGQFNGDFYGTSVASVLSVVEAGLVCVLTMQPAGLRALRRHPARLMPYAVFVSPPASLNGLRVLRRKLGPAADLAPEDSDDELRKLLELSRQMEESCSHLVDRVLVNTDPGASVAQLLGLASRLEREPQWVPAKWLQPSGTGQPDICAVGHNVADTAC